MAKFINITNQSFGRLTAVEIDKEKSRPGHIWWKCICICGTEISIFGGQLREGHTNSCGCLRKENGRKLLFKHGMKDTPEYHSWTHMISRCRNPSNKKYPNYGGRGITVCERWLHSFESFYADMGPRPSPKHSIERVDNHGNYEYDNCKWATNLEQARNRRSNIPISFMGKTKTIMEWSQLLDIPYMTLHSRFLRLKWSVERALSTPSPQKKTLR